MLTDTHCHLQRIEALGENEADMAVLAAQKENVSRIVNVGLGPDDNEKVIEQASKHKEVYAAVGWHPLRKTKITEDELETIAQLSTNSKVVLIGEIGLDYFWRPGYNEVPIEIQRYNFREMLKLSAKVDKSVCVHVRESFEDVLEDLYAVPDAKGIIHSFIGNKKMADAFLERGMYLSLSGPLTYPKNQELRDAVKDVSISRLLVETDAPYLPPQPWRGQKSRPAMVVETAKTLAEIQKLTLEEVAEFTSANASAIFGLPLLEKTTTVQSLA
jgi:TatD DNase family protein